MIQFSGQQAVMLKDDRSDDSHGLQIPNNTRTPEIKK